MWEKPALEVDVFLVYNSHRPSATLASRAATPCDSCPPSTVWHLYNQRGLQATCLWVKENVALSY